MNSQIKKHEIFKQLCISSYHPKQELPQGYERLFSKPGNKGFYADVIKNKNDVVIVYRGTDNVDGLKDDLKMWYQKQLPTQEREALDLYDEVNKYCKKNGYNITVIGHSLGGSLAQIVSAKRDVDAVTFNAYGVKNLLDPNIKYCTDKVINYCCDEDIITRINAENHIGKCFSITSSDFRTNPHVLENMDSLEKRKEVSGEYLQHQYHKAQKAKGELDYYIQTGKHIPIRMSSVGFYSDNCVGTYQVSGYTRNDGTKVSSYERTCGAKHLGPQRASDKYRGLRLDQMSNSEVDELLDELI